MQHALDIARDQVDFQIDLRALDQLAERRVFNGMGNQVDADLAARHLVGVACQVADPVHRQAHAVDGDGAFVGQVFAQRLRRKDAKLPAFANLGEMRDAANAIDMA